MDVMSNMLSSIKNASLAGKPSLEVMYTKQCEAVAKVLKNTGYISDVKVFKESGKPFKKLKIDLAYDAQGNPVITDLKRVSRPGRRVYRKASDITRFRGGFGTRVISTSRGIVQDDEARRRKLGGEVICQIY